MTSILMCDYFIVRHRNVSVPDMYWFHGIYRYSPKFATNWRAVAAFFIGCTPPLPGFVNNIVVAGGDTTKISTGGQHLFAIGYIYSFVAAGLFYWLFMKFFPHHESMLNAPDTGEEIIAANDAKNVQERRASYAEGHKPSIVTRAFQV